MDNTILISIIITAYNVADLLPRCLNSIVNQSYKNLEIIVINDGSSDETDRVIAEYAKKDSRVIAINQRNVGLVESRERGIMSATGDYVGFVDGDDSVTEDMYERLLHNAITHHADISQCGIMYCFSDGRRKPMHGTGVIVELDTIAGLKELLKGELFEPSLCNKIYRKELLVDSCLDKSVINNEDLLRNFVLFQRAEKSVLEDFSGYYYWRRDESMSNSNEHLVAIAKNIIKARRAILENRVEEITREAYRCWLFALILSFGLLRNFTSIEANELKKYCRSELKKEKKHFFYLGRRQKIKALMIIYTPGLYKLAEDINWSKKKRSISQQVKALQNT